MTRAGLVLALCLGTGCVVPFKPSERWKEFNPPRAYQAWHQEVEVCVGARRDFADLAWRQVYAPSFYCGDVGGATGCYTPPGVIYIAEPSVHTEVIVKAELIHYVRRYLGHDELSWRCEGSDP